MKTHHIKVWTKSQAKEVYELMIESGYELTTSHGTWDDEEGCFFKFEDFLSIMSKDENSELFVLRIKVGLIAAVDEFEEEFLKQEQ